MAARHTAHRSVHVAGTHETAVHVPTEQPTQATKATQASIAAAREAQRRERDEFMAWSGIRLNRDGRPVFTHRLVRRDGHQG